MPTPDLIQRDGVLAVVYMRDDKVQSFDGPDLWPDLAVCVLGLFCLCSASSLRVHIDGHVHTVHALRVDSRSVAVVTETGHPVNKSVRRLMRRALRT